MAITEVVANRFASSGISVAGPYTLTVNFPETPLEGDLQVINIVGGRDESFFGRGQLDFIVSDPSWLYVIGGGGVDMICFARNAPAGADSTFAVTIHGDTDPTAHLYLGVFGNVFRSDTADPALFLNTAARGSNLNQGDTIVYCDGVTSGGTPTHTLLTLQHMGDYTGEYTPPVYFPDPYPLTAAGVGGTFTSLHGTGIVTPTAAIANNFPGWIAVQYLEPITDLGALFDGQEHLTFTTSPAVPTNSFDALNPIQVTYFMMTIGYDSAPPPPPPPPDVNVLAPAGIASGQTLGTPAIPAPLDCPAPVGSALRLLEHADTKGAWQVYGLRVVWQFDGREVPLNASQITVTDTPKWSAPDLLSGDTVLAALREYDEILPGGATRPGVIRDMPKKIELTFPRLPASFYGFFRRYRSFTLPLRVELALFDALDPEELQTLDGQNYYASTGGWKPESYEVFVNGVEQCSGFAVNQEWGYVAFDSPLPTGARVTATYIWTPRCIFTGELTPTFRANSSLPGAREAEIALTLQEVRPTAAATRVSILGAPSIGPGALGVPNVLLATIDPATLSGWQMLLDARSITGHADGDPLAVWPDSSGHGRNEVGTAAYKVVGPAPWVDFYHPGVNTGMTASIGGAPVDCTAGFSLYTIYFQEHVNASQSSPAGFEDSWLAQSPSVNGFTLFAQQFQSSTPGSTNAAMAFDCNQGLVGGGPAAGVHVISVIGTAPQDGAGTLTMWVDGAQVAQVTHWHMSPNDNLSGIGVALGNSADSSGRQLQARIGWFGWASRADSDSTRQGIEAYLRNAWG